MGHFRDGVLAATALEILEDAEVMQEFEDSVWVKIDREAWEAFLEEQADD